MSSRIQRACLNSRKHFNRNLRLYLLFVTVLTWYIFERFGGVSYRRTADRSPAANSSSGVQQAAPLPFCSGRMTNEGGPGFWFVVFLLQSGCQARLSPHTVTARVGFRKVVTIQRLIWVFPELYRTG
jgi:hypothetical protein